MCSFGQPIWLAQLNAVLWAKPFMDLRLRSGVLLICAKDLFVGAKHGLPAKLRHREPVFIADDRLAVVASPRRGAAPETVKRQRQTPAG